jgi:hypothetical protein
MKLKLGLPIPFRPYHSDAVKIAEMADVENRPESVMMRILLHEAILARNTVRVEIIGKLNNHMTPDDLERMQEGD